MCGTQTALHVQKRTAMHLQNTNSTTCIRNTKSTTCTEYKQHYIGVKEMRINLLVTTEGETPRIVERIILK
jgi:hypothetical protein